MRLFEQKYPGTGAIPQGYVKQATLAEAINELNNAVKSIIPPENMIQIGPPSSRYGFFTQNKDKLAEILKHYSAGKTDRDAKKEERDMAFYLFTLSAVVAKDLLWEKGKGYGLLPLLPEEKGDEPIIGGIPAGQSIETMLKEGNELELAWENIAEFIKHTEEYRSMMNYPDKPHTYTSENERKALRLEGAIVKYMESTYNALRREAEGRKYDGMGMLKERLENLLVDHIRSKNSEWSTQKR